MRDIVGGLRASDANFDKIAESKAVLTIEAFESFRIAPTQFAPEFLVVRHRCPFSTLLFAPEGQIVQTDFTRREPRVRRDDRGATPLSHSPSIFHIA